MTTGTMLLRMIFTWELAEDEGTGGNACSSR